MAHLQASRETRRPLRTHRKTLATLRNAHDIQQRRRAHRARTRTPRLVARTPRRLAHPPIPVTGASQHAEERIVCVVSTVTLNLEIRQVSERARNHQTRWPGPSALSARYSVTRPHRPHPRAGGSAVTPERPAHPVIIPGEGGDSPNKHGQQHTLGRGAPTEYPATGRSDPP